VDREKIRPDMSVLQMMDPINYWMLMFASTICILMDVLTLALSAQPSVMYAVPSIFLHILLCGVAFITVCDAGRVMHTEDQEDE
jgi:hypothetical protein